MGITGFHGIAGKKIIKHGLIKTHHIVNHIFFVMRRFTGSSFRFPGLKFNFVISNGAIKVGHHTMKLVKSTNKKYSTRFGWMMFTYMKWTYYIRITLTGIRVVGYHGKKMVVAKVHKVVHKVSKKPHKGKPHYHKGLIVHFTGATAS